MTTETFATLPLSKIVSSLTNPRKTFNQVKLTELAESIKASGVHQPILVRPLPSSRVPETDRAVTHEIISGERRFRACVMAGLTSIPTMVRELTDDQVLEVQLVENLQRDDLTELEEAEGYQILMQASGLTADAVGIKIGKSRSYVFGRLKLLDLCAEARDKLRDGSIDFSRGLLLARIPDHTLQLKALEYITEKDYQGDVVGYREAFAHVQRDYMLHLDRARFKITDATLTDAGSCKSCAKRTGHDPDLFSDVQGADVCTDPPCYHRKEQAHTDAQLRSAHESGQTVITGREAKELMPNSWGGVEGYLRLDNVQDSPTDKPLRKLLGKQLEADGVQTTLIANPYKDGELIAVLPSATVAELLKAKGHQDAAERIDESVNRSKKQEQEQAKADFVKKFEQGWRDALLERTWTEIMNDPGTEIGVEVLRHIAMHFAKACNTEQAKRLCKLLDLGKVAPMQALQDYVRDADCPHDVLQLLVMHRDVEYRPWLSEHEPTTANSGLMLIADDWAIDIDAVKDGIKGKLRGTPQVVEIYRGPNGETWSGRGLKPRWVRIYIENGGELANLLVRSLPTTGTPAAQAKGGGGGRKPKTTAQEATAQIAAAMQAQEGTNQGADAQGIDANSIQTVATPGAIAPTASLSVGIEVGTRVRVTTDDDKLGLIARKWSGKEGTVTKREDSGGFWHVTFKGRNGGIAMFAEDQIEVVGVVAPQLADENLDDDYRKALVLVRQHNKPSISLVQRHLAIGYDRAAHLLERMETEGIVSPMKSNGQRTVIQAVSA